MIYNALLDEANAEGLSIKERPFKTYDGRIKGNNIYLRENMNTTEKACVLAEELGHHYTSVGCILDQTDLANRKQERQARLWGYNKLIGLMGIVRAFNAGCQNQYEIADYLDVTEEYLQECINCYQSKYGICTTVDNYVIYFVPYLTVTEMI
ncbi:ImmA/IrrE family metallo-endopeptidase [[Ruminococcus] lactaris]|uniref:ImmA/IrrE family metallo-endopeptidase n=1 Tax=[Ruminococcus] lactaris TaxID=46228 RepID=UPI00265E3D0D|nr:ImmA/IrrE family metallo-endopeptidase [[Ruminococcus] lactaris]